MRGTIIVGMVAALALAGCGQPQTKAPDASAGMDDLSGRLWVYGADFSLNADREQGVMFTHPQDAMTVLDPYVEPEATGAGWVLRTTRIELTITPVACTHDGASYPMSASVAVSNGPPMEGCAVMQWDRHLLALMPQIDACIAQSPETRMVTFAGETGDGIVTVRLQGSGMPVDCTVADGAVAITPRRTDLHIGGEGFAVFVRGPGENPGGECYEAPEVRAANGDLLGWMADPEGC